MGRSWLLSVVTLKRRLPLARLPWHCISFWARSLSTGMPLINNSFHVPGQPQASWCLGLSHLDVHQQRVVADIASLRRSGFPRRVLVVSGYAGLQHTTLNRDRPYRTVCINGGVLQLRTFTKYAVAFLGMSRSIFMRANSACSQLISI